MALYRTALGYVLRTERLKQGMTMRDVSQRAPMALGYLSEVERGQKDASSEILDAISNALGVSVAELSRSVADVLTDWEQQRAEARELMLLTK